MPITQKDVEEVKSGKYAYTPQKSIARQIGESMLGFVAPQHAARVKQKEAGLRGKTTPTPTTTPTTTTTTTTSTPPARGLRFDDGGVANTPPSNVATVGIGDGITAKTRQGGTGILAGDKTSYTTPYGTLVSTGLRKGGGTLSNVGGPGDNRGLDLTTPEGLRQGIANNVRAYQDQIDSYRALREAQNPGITTGGFNEGLDRSDVEYDLAQRNKVREDQIRQLSQVIPGAAGLTRSQRDGIRQIQEEAVADAKSLRDEDISIANIAAENRRAGLREQTLRRGQDLELEGDTIAANAKANAENSLTPSQQLAQREKVFSNITERLTNAFSDIDKDPGLVKNEVSRAVEMLGPKIQTAPPKIVNAAVKAMITMNSLPQKLQDATGVLGFGQTDKPPTNTPQQVFELYDKVSSALANNQDYVELGRGREKFPLDELSQTEKDQLIGLADDFKAVKNFYNVE